MNDLTLCGHIVRVNDDGFVSLTDMWHASGGKNQHRPNLFLRNDRVRDFIQSLESKVQKCALTILKGGRTPGTWAHKLLAYKYASWIDPEFEVGTYTVLDSYFTGDLISKDSWQVLHQFLLDDRLSKDLGSFHGKGLNQRRLEKTELQQRHEKLLEKYQHITRWS